MQLVFRLILVKCFIIIFIKSVLSWRLGEEIHWLPDLEWSTKNNWLNNKIPTDNSHILFPLEIKHSVGFPLNGNFQYSGIYLPRDGSLLLFKNGNLKLSNSNDKKFKNNISQWKWSKPFYWIDPNNWNNTNLAMPHLEKIPCSTDTVVLPDKQYSLSIKLPNVNVKVKKIKIGTSLIGNMDWELTMEGREFRKSHQSVKFSGLQYCAAEECVCRHDDENVELLISEICKIQSPRCNKNKISCESPLKVEGHCCEYCGSRVLIDHKVSLLELQELSNEALNKYKDTVSWHARMTWDESLEVLIIENGEYTGIKNQEAMNRLVEALTAKGISVMSKTGAGAPLAGSIFPKSLIPMLGVLLLLILIFFIALPYFGYTYTQFFSVLRDMWPLVREGVEPSENPATLSGTFNFARFQNIADGDIQLANTAFEEEENNINVEDETSHKGKRFENPLYRSKKREALKELSKLDEPIIDVNSTLRLTDLQTKLSSEETDVDSE